MSAGRKNNTTNKNYNTPPKYVDVVMEFFDGKLDLDPCSNEFSLIKAANNWVLPNNAFDKDKTWNCKTIFINPPYGRDSERKTSIYNWVEKAKDAHLHFNSEILMLIPVAANTRHFKNLIFKHFTGICFLEDTRLKFYNEGEELKKGCPVAICMVYIGKNYNKFRDVFEKYGKCLKLNE